MTPDANNPERMLDAQHDDQQRYASLHIDDGEMVIYDLSNHQAWIQSNHAVSIDGMA